MSQTICRLQVVMKTLIAEMNLEPLRHSLFQNIPKKRQVRGRTVIAELFSVQSRFPRLKHARALISWAFLIGTSGSRHSFNKLVGSGHRSQDFERAFQMMSPLRLVWLVCVVLHILTDLSHHSSVGYAGVRCVDILSDISTLVLKSSLNYLAKFFSNNPEGRYPNS